MKADATHATKQEFAATVDPLNLPGELAYVSQFIKADTRAGVTIAAALDANRLKRLAAFMGCTQAGTKAELLNRVFVFKATYLFLLTQTRETLGALTNRELDNALAGGGESGSYQNKPQKIDHLLGFPELVRRRVQLAAADVIQFRIIKEAFFARQPIGAKAATAWDLTQTLEAIGYQLIGGEYVHNGSVEIAYEIDGKIVPLETFNRMLATAMQELTWKHNGLAVWWGRYWDYHPGGTWPDREFAARHFQTAQKLIAEAAEHIRELEQKYFRLLEIRTGPKAEPLRFMFQSEMPLLANPIA